MKHILQNFRTILHDPDGRTFVPFFWFLTLGVIFMYGWSVYGTPELQTPGRLVVFTLLVVLHILIHWASLLLAEKPTAMLAYFGIQAALAFVIIQYSQSYAMGYGLYMPLIGEAFGTFQKNSFRIPVVIVMLGLSALNIFLLADMQEFTTWLVTIIPLVFFVIIYVIMYLRQVDARQEALELLKQLEQANQQLAESSRQIEALTLTTERQRMARELHDTLAQGLAGLILQLEAVDSHLSSGRAERAKAIVEQAMSRARTTLADARRAINDLRTGPLSAPDLAEAIRMEVDRFCQTTGIECHSQIQLDGHIDVQQLEFCQRFIAEGLNNIARHARASRVTIEATNSDEELRIMIEDDGVGFKPETEIGRAGHYGLLGMRERVRHAGGSIVIESQPGKGSRLEARVPAGMPERLPE